MNSLLVNPNDKGNAIQVTYADGSTGTLPLAIVGGGKAAYVATEAGAYKLIDNTKIFNDTSGHWARQDIDLVTRDGLFAGVGNGSFDPNGTMTRAMLATVLWRIAGNQDGSGTFADVNSGSWFAVAAAWAGETGVMTEDGTSFMPNEPITREQLCTTVMRFVDWFNLTLADTGARASFPDAGSISGWAADAVNAAVATGLVNGRTDGSFDPQGYATRAEVAAVFARLINNVVPAK